MQKALSSRCPPYLIKGINAHPSAKQVRSSYDISTPLVGRIEEFASLSAAIQHLGEGQGAIIGIIGEAGLGKSRLIAESHRSNSGNHYLWLKADTRIDGRSISYWPFREILHQQAGITADDSEAIAFQKLDLSVSKLFPDNPAVVLPYLASLLNLPLTRRYAEQLLYMDSDAMGRQIFFASRQFFKRLSQAQPLILVFEDLHWMDQSSTQLLKHLMPLTKQVPLLIIGTSRPYRDSPAVSLREFSRQELSDRYIELPLAPLSLGESSQMIGKMLQDEALSVRVRELIIQKAGGNPLYVEEVIRSLIDSHVLEWSGAEGKWKAAQQIDLSYIPDTIQGLIAARLDRLGDEVKRLLRIAAVIGQTFPYAVLRAVAPEFRHLDAQLLELQQVEMITAQRGKPELEYNFKHALVQEVVYASLTLQKRKELHHHVGRAMEELYAERLDEFYVLLAYHYAQSETWEKAQHYLLKAGDQAGRLAADTEALTIYEEAIMAYGQAFGEKWDTFQRANLDRKIGAAYARQGTFEQALEKFHQALSLLGAPFPTSPLRVRIAIAGELVRQIGHRIFPTLSFGRGKIANPSAVDEEILLYEDMGWIYAFRDVERFLLCPLKELNLSERQKNLFGIVMASSTLGIFFDLIPVFSIAQIYHRMAMRLVEKVKNPIAKGQVYLGLSFHAFYKGEIDTAIEYIARTNDFYFQAGDLRLLAGAKQYITVAAFQKGDFSTVAKIGRELIRIGQDSNVLPSWCHGLWAQGSVLRLQGKTVAAIDIQKQAIEMAEKVTDSQYYVLAGSELILCYLQSGQLAEALPWLEKLEALNRQDDFLLPHAVARSIYSQATTYLAAAEGSSGADREAWLGRSHRARQDFIKLSKSFPTYLPEAQYIKGKYEWLQGHRDKARQSWCSSLSAAQALGMTYNQAVAHWELGWRFENHEHLEKAEAIFSAIGAEFDAARARILLDRG